MNILESLINSIIGAADAGTDSAKESQRGILSGPFPVPKTAEEAAGDPLFGWKRMQEQGENMSDWRHEPARKANAANDAWTEIEKQGLIPARKARSDYLTQKYLNEKYGYGYLDAAKNQPDYNLPLEMIQPQKKQSEDNPKPGSMLDMFYDYLRSGE